MVRVSCLLLLLLYPAVQGIAQGRKNQPKKLPVLFAQAQKALDAKDYPKAEQAFREVIKLDPRSVAAYSNLGVVYMHTNRINLAIHSFETAHKLAPNETGIDLNLGLAYFREHRFKDAVPLFRRVLASNPGNDQARYLEGLCYFQIQDYKHTVEALAPLSTKERHNVDFLFVLGTSYGMVNQQAESEKTFAQMVRVGGKSPQMHLLMGELYLHFYYRKDQKAFLQKALVELNKAIADNPRMPFAHFTLGVVDQRLGLLDKAADEYTKEITINPREPRSYQDLGKIWLDRRKPNQAIPLFRHALSLNSKLPLSWAGLGSAYLQKKDFVKAITYYHRALELDPDKAGFHYQLGQAYLRAGRKAAAQKEFAETQRLQASALRKQADQLKGAK